MLLEVGSIIAGKFRLERPLAQGGMGSVWVAFNMQLEVPVALKFMAPALVESPELVARFEREAKAAAQLRNPHVVQIFEHGVDRGTPFIAMELLEGEDMGARLQSKGRLSVQETARILGDVCKALRRAHDMGLVHRDLKPANIFLASHEEYEVVKILDFGIAKAIAHKQGEVTKSGSLVGSPHYMSPEQARRTNKQVDHRADLWAVGVIAFRCLAGRLPFPGDDVIDVLVRVCTDAPPVPSSIAADLGPEVDRFFARALAHDPDERFQSAKEMAEALTALAARPALVSLSVRSSPSVPLPETRPSAAANVVPARQPEGLSSGAILDDAKTIPIVHRGAQRAIATTPWIDPEALNESAPIAGPLHRAPASAKANVAPTAGDTFASAGAELEARPGPMSPKTERPWIAVVAAGAALAVIGVISLAAYSAQRPRETPSEGRSAAITEPPPTPAAAAPLVTGTGVAAPAPSGAPSSAPLTSAAPDRSASSTVNPNASAKSAATAKSPAAATVKQPLQPKVFINRPAQW